jgi:hypothetical protein
MDRRLSGEGQKAQTLSSRLVEEAPAMMQAHRVFLDWRHGRIGPPEPCVLCGKPALCRSPVKGVPCHKTCAETWIDAHALDDADRARLIRTYTTFRFSGAGIAVSARPRPSFCVVSGGRWSLIDPRAPA